MSWDFADFPGRFPVDVIEAVPDERIVIAWEGNGHTTAPKTETTFEFTPVDDGTRTLVTITEKAWGDDRRGSRGRLRQLDGLDRDARRAQGLGRVRHQPPRGLLQVDARYSRRARRG